MIPTSSAVRPQDLADEAIALVRRWLSEAAGYPVDSSAALLADERPLLQKKHA